MEANGTEMVILDDELKKLQGMTDCQMADESAETGENDEVDRRSIYVGNVDYSTKPHDLQEFFKASGQINRITIMVDKWTGKPKGYAYIEFANEDAVNNAVMLNDCLFKDRIIKVIPKRKNIPGYNRKRAHPIRGRGRGFRPMRLARASYATASDADIDENVPDQGEFLAGNKRTRNTKTDFWSRVDAGEINIQSALDAWRNNSNITPQSVVDTTIPNYAISTTNLSDYSYKTTVFGDVYYSPRFNDNKYTYRFVILTKGVRNEAYRILKSCGRHFLTEMQIIHQLGIDLSPGWEHFMVFRNKLEELILRRPLDGIGLLRQLQFEEFLYRKVAPVAEKTAFFVVNNHARTGSKAVVMGLAGKPEQFVKDVEETKARGISLIRRFTGGGTVIVDECSLNTSFIASTWFAKDVAPTDICRWSYEKVFLKSGIFNDRFVFVEGDYVVKKQNHTGDSTANRNDDGTEGEYSYHKVAGNSQAFNAKAFVHHTVFPWNISPLISQILLQPSKAPDYRRGRHHTDFMRSVTEALDPDQGISSITEFEEKLCGKVGTTFGSMLDRVVHISVSKSETQNDICDALDSHKICLSEEFIEQAIATLPSPATKEY
ncbi:RNA binding protein protein [Babesia ovis]|uniref:Cyclin-dependent kinases regulatory subunit n=1 Tax=Babesia ovis TaxID=5869 RepID=A0A9W5TDJ1_BABOV|nr:RNA binding protein protein [Babesia ovis]